MNAGYDSNSNNQSLVVRLSHKKTSLLFTGDISREEEEDLIHTTPDLKSTILKVPHHGSDTSSSLPFLTRVQPRIAIVSVGFQNNFHLPNRNVIQRYHDAGSQIFRTDLDGAITIETDGSDIRIKTFSGREWSDRE